MFTNRKNEFKSEIGMESDVKNSVKENLKTLYMIPFRFRGGDSGLKFSKILFEISVEPKDPLGQLFTDFDVVGQLWRENGYGNLPRPSKTKPRSWPT